MPENIAYLLSIVSDLFSKKTMQRFRISKVSLCLTCMSYVLKLKLRLPCIHKPLQIQGNW